jgi:release factor glutamine methyltransferase
MDCPVSTKHSSGGVDQSAEWTIGRILGWTTQYLREHGSDTPRLETEILLAHACGCERIQLYTNFDRALNDGERSVMRELVRRRARAEPVAYLVGHREFFGLDFRVTSDVLIPRPDTETLVMALLESAGPLERPRVLDVGTGSGCIAVAAAVNLPGAALTAVDVSETALAIARDNAETHGVADRIRFLEGDLFEPLATGEPFDIVASNPPYVAEHEFDTLQQDVRAHEPHVALFGGPDGLAVLRRLVEGCLPYLVDGGHLLLEISPEQADEVVRLLETRGGYTDVAVVSDLSGRSRVVRARKAG